jgi:GDPmannose 4,6-dehydratase
VLENVELLKVNLSDLTNIIKTIDKVQPNEIYNLAAQSSVGLSFDQPIWTYEFNTLSTLNLLEAIRLINTEIKFYQASSSEMYGNIDKDKLPVTENHYLNPSSPYGVSKASAHMITTSYRQSYNLFACCGILFNHESCLRGQSFVTKKIIETAINISKGNSKELTLGNLNVFRDWGYAPEYIKVIWMILQHDSADDFVICSGEVHSLEDFVSEVFSNLDMDYKEYLKEDLDLYRPLELEIIYGDNSKAKKILGWNYEIPFKDLIEKLVEDYSIHYEFH